MKQPKRTRPEPITLTDAAVALYRASIAASEAKGLEETTKAYAAWVDADRDFKGAVLRELNERDRTKKWRARLRDWEQEREELERRRPSIDDPRNEPRVDDEP